MVVFGPQRPNGREALEVYELAPLGRSLQRRQVYASDARFALGSMPQNAEPREEPWGRGLRHNAGLMFEGVCHNGKPIVPGGASSWDVAIGSLVIYRKRSKGSLDWRRIALKMDGVDVTEEEEGWGTSRGDDGDELIAPAATPAAAPAAAPAATPGAAPASAHANDQADEDPTNFFEEYLPPWCLRGLLPEALLDEYDFWRVGETTLRGYSKKSGAGGMTSLHVRLTEATYCEGQASLLGEQNQSSDAKGAVASLGPFELKTIGLDRVDFAAAVTHKLASMTDFGYTPAAEAVVPKDEKAAYILATASLVAEHDVTSMMPATADEFIRELSDGERPCFQPVEPPLQCTEPQKALLPALIAAYNAAASGAARFELIAKFLAEAQALEAAAPQKLGEEEFVCTQYDIYKTGPGAAVFAESFPWGDAAHLKTLGLGVLRWARFKANLVELEPQKFDGPSAEKQRDDALAVARKSVGRYTMEQGAAAGVLSPVMPVTLEDDRQHANIHIDAAFFAFAYPATTDAGPVGVTGSRKRLIVAEDVFNFKRLGGFVYFDEQMNVCQLACLTVGPGLHFKREMLADAAHTAVRASLQAAGRMQVVTLDSLLESGVRTFCWLGPAEHVDGIDQAQAAKMWPHGAYVYCYGEEDIKYDSLFRVLGPDERPDEASAMSEVMKRSRTQSKEAMLGHAMPLGERVKQIELHNGWFAVVRRLTRERDECHVETLVNLHAAPRHSCMGRLADVLTRMENLSHVLAWAQGDVRPGETTAVTKVEMPRMQLRFVAQYGQLASLDHDGCFVSDAAVTNSEALKSQLRILDTSLVLENRQREVFILTPSYGLLRPYIQACPMSTALIMDRSYDGWRKHVKATHHKLQLHASGSFLMTQSLSAAMYLLAVRLFKREYALAARLLSSVLSDVPFVNEESWIKSLYARLADDPHPDAIAMRLRLALQCNDCNELPPFGGGDESKIESVEEWEALQQHRASYMRREFDHYIYKWPSVSAACRLTIEQEWQLAKMLNHQKRKKFLERLRKCEAKPKHGHHLTHYHVALTEPRVGGKLFIDLAGTVGETPEAIKGLRDADLLESSSQGGGGAQGDQPGFRYKRPENVRANGFEALRAVENVYAEKLRCDASHGWLYLYDLMTGTIGLSFTSQEDSVKQEYPEATTFGAAQAATPERIVDSSAASDWGSLPEGKAAFESWASAQGAWNSHMENVFSNSEPVQAGTRGNGGAAQLTAVPKLLFQMLYLAMITNTTKLAYSADGPMWKIFAILSHTYDQMMDQIGRDNSDVATDVEKRAQQSQEDANRAAEAASKAKTLEAYWNARPQKFTVTTGKNGTYGISFGDNEANIIKMEEGGKAKEEGKLRVGDVVTHVDGEGPLSVSKIISRMKSARPSCEVTIKPRDAAAAAALAERGEADMPENVTILPPNVSRQNTLGGDDDDDDDDYQEAQPAANSWWGMVAGAGADAIASASIDVEKKGDLAQKAMKLLPRFPYHENQPACTHSGLLLGKNHDADSFIAGLALVCEWYAYGEEGPPLENRADFRYLASETMPAPQRENLESVFLKPTHVRLFNLCMPDISDFAQSRRELNDEQFELSASKLHMDTSGLMLDDEQVRAFASRPLDHVHTLSTVDPASGEATHVGHTITDFVQCNRLERTFTKAHEGMEAVVRDGKPVLLQPDEPRPAFDVIRIDHVEDGPGGTLTLSTGEVHDNPHSVTLAPVGMLPYTEDVKCVEVEQILEGGVHAKLPIDDIFFRRGAANTFNARKIVERLQHDLGSSAENMSLGYVASMKLLDSAAMMVLRAQTSDPEVTDDTAVERITGTKQMPEMLSQLKQLLQLLEQERQRDMQKVIDGTAMLVELANSSSIKSKGARERLQFQLKRLGGQRAPLHFEFIAASMLSSQCSADLQRLNPLLDHNAASHELPKACASILLNTIRLCQTNRAIVHANSLKKDIGTLLKQQLRTQVAAELVLREQRPPASFLDAVAEQSRLPTEELLSWSMRTGGDDPVVAVRCVHEQLAEAGTKEGGTWQQRQNCATLVADLATELTELSAELERGGDDYAARVTKLGGLVRLAIHLSNYDADEAKQLLQNPAWALMAIDLRHRGCQVPMLKQDQLQGAPLRPPTLSGLGSDASCARFAPLINAKPTRQSLVALPEREEGCTSVMRSGVNLMGAMLHAMLHTSLTLAAELTARRHYMQPKFVEQPWTDSEDATLRAWVLRSASSRNMSSRSLMNPKVWAVVAGRDGRACKERWENVLDPRIETDPALKAAAARKLQPTKWIYDPRFLVFEFLLGFMLRRRQFELVTEFANAAMEGRSSVNQMIMGQGKTTVIAPMLALLLGDGKRLIFQVCPGPLLEMSRSVMRISFSNVIHKRVRTFTFDRSNPIGNSLEGLTAQYETLASACEEKAVVCSTPESIKSFMLKYIDNLRVPPSLPSRADVAYLLGDTWQVH